MPFIAKNKKRKRIDINEYNDPRNEISSEGLVCPLCGTQMFIRGGPEVIYHFYHKNKCSNNFDRHPESIEHLQFKKKIAESLKSEIKVYSDATICYEFPIEEMKRIADIMMVFPNGWMVAHEIQLSYITVDELSKRTEDYLNAGIDVIWWLGKSANKKSNRDWCRENLGVCYTLNLS